MSWVILAILAPACFAINNFMDRFLVDKKIKNPVVLTIFAGVIMFVFGLLTLAIIHFPILPFGQTVLLLISGVLIGIGIWPYYAAIAIDDASRVVPFFQTIPIMVLVLSYIFLHESLLPHHLVGVVIIIIGAFLLSVKEFNRNLFRLRKSLWYMLLAGACVAISIVLFRFVVVRQSFWASFGYDFVGEGLGGMALLFLSRHRQSSRRELKNITANLLAIFGVNQAVYTIGRFFAYKAISLAPVTLVSAFGGVQPFFVLFFGVILSVWFPNIVQEDIRRSTIAIKFLSIILIFVGVWFIYN